MTSEPAILAHAPAAVCPRCGCPTVTLSLLTHQDVYYACDTCARRWTLPRQALRGGVTTRTSPLPGAHRWLDVRRLADVHASSSEPSHPIEDAFCGSESGGWRAAATGTQIIAIRFHEPRDLHHVQLVFDAPTATRTQAIVIAATTRRGEQTREIIRRETSLAENEPGLHVENYPVTAPRVGALEIRIQPDPRDPYAVATLRACRLA